MNTIHRRAQLLGSSALCLILCAGCLETETTTTIQTDGTLTRTVQLSGDSSSIPAGLEMFGIDSSWTLERQAGKDQRLVLTAVRAFPDVQEMARSLAGSPGHRVNIVPSLETRFAWFFTTFRYSESWGRLNPVQAVPLSDFLSQEEIDALDRSFGEDKDFPTKGDSLAAEDVGDRFNAWERRNTFEGFFTLYLGGIRALNSTSLTETMARSHKEELFASAEHFGWGSGSIDSLVLGWSTILGDSQALQALQANRAAIDDFQQRMAFLQNVMSTAHKVHVQMPGLLTATNGNVEGNRVTWGDFIGRTYITDVTMWAESSVTNWWAIVVSGIVVLGIIGLTVAGLYRRRR